MPIVIIGAGLTGLTTAFELLNRGYQVELIDAESGEGLGASFANGGLLTPSMSDPWNAPGVHRHLPEYLFSASSDLKLRWRAIPSLLTWGPRFLLNSRPDRYREAILANYELATYSLDVLAELRRDLDLSFEASDRGTLKFFRSSRAFEAALQVVRGLRECGLHANELDPEQAVGLEPCLEPIVAQLAGAIFYPQDGSGDAYLFCQSIADHIRKRGGRFHFGRKVRSIQVERGKVIGINLGDELLPATSVVVAAGVDSPDLLRKLGGRIAIKPVKGYSVTYTPPAGQRLPAIPVIDDAYHAAITPLGARLRAVGTAEFAGRNRHLDRKRIANLNTFMTAIYPDIATPNTLKTGQPWAGLRPVAADGRPYIGQSETKGLWVNSGHGHLGWTLAAGSARLLADLMTGRPTEISANPYSTSR